MPGLRDRLVEAGPRLRPHINVFVDGEPADLATPVRAGRGRPRPAGGERRVPASGECRGRPPAASATG